MSAVKNEIRAFLRRTGMPKTKFGRLVMKDPAFVDRLYREEYTPRPGTVEKLKSFIKEYQS